MVIDTGSDDLPEYCVSRLPNDIIVNIFSRLSLREAARTSIVSSRWRYLWTFTANLVFVAPKTVDYGKTKGTKNERKSFQLISNGRYRRRTINQFPRLSHQHLKVVEFIGFVGCPVDLELAFYLLENATILEKMSVNPTSPFLIGTYFEFYNDEKKQTTRKRTKQLKKRVPQSVELVIC
ncbi:hypothetical protein Dsin_032658 [Dipteronia sinensis]|uniref:F-box domain-containing protein n=1 Tax=Dipteronia sinensis TaxID=43782 RepID=A0AAE0DHF6_9ROSI|nr:hypothetical protein Dsin_032658 [Dipteronia sinensis]